MGERFHECLTDFGRMDDLSAQVDQSFSPNDRIVYSLVVTFRSTCDTRSGLCVRHDILARRVRQIGH
jgi:hypothetical protein